MFARIASGIVSRFLALGIGPRRYINAISYMNNVVTVPPAKKGTGHKEWMASTDAHSRKAANL